MSRLRKISLLAALILAQAPVSVFAEIYLKPGDSGEFAFTVVNALDSVDVLSTPQVVYDNQPSWFSMGNVSLAAYDSLKQGTSCQITMDFSIAGNAPSSTEDLSFKVTFPSPNIYPPVWYPAENIKMITDATPPSLSVIQPKWLDYSPDVWTEVEGLKYGLYGPGKVLHNSFTLLKG